MNNKKGNKYIGTILSVIESSELISAHENTGYFENMIQQHQLELFPSYRQFFLIRLSVELNITVWISHIRFIQTIGVIIAYYWGILSIRRIKYIY